MGTNNLQLCDNYIYFFTLVLFKKFTFSAVKTESNYIEIFVTLSLLKPLLHFKAVKVPYLNVYQKFGLPRSTNTVGG